MAIGSIIVPKKVNQIVTNATSNNNAGFMLISFLVGLFLLTLLSASFFRYHHSLNLFFSRQQILIEGERLAFAQLDIYPKLITFDNQNWLRQIDYHIIEHDCYFLNVVFEHKQGHRSHQKRIRCIDERIVPTKKGITTEE